MTQPNTKSPYRATPQGEGRHCWITKPDTKYQTDGVYHTQLGLDGDVAQKFKAEIDAECELGFTKETEELSVGEKKKWSVYRPYIIDETEDGTPTGRIWFLFRQNAVITVEGAKKQIEIGVYDSKDKPLVGVPVYSGSVLKVRFKPRSNRIVSNKQAGVRLDFLKVQVIELKTRDQSKGGFGEVEGGYVGDAAEMEPTGFGSTGSATGDF